MKRITIMSRQSDAASIDIEMLATALRETGEFEVKVMCRKLTSRRALTYPVHMLSQLREIRRSDALIVDGYCIVNSLVGHPRRLKVVQMWHALSAIKQFGWQTVGKSDGSSETIARLMRMHAGYDYILSSSDITAGFFCEGFRADPEKIVKLGLPRIDYILKRVPQKAEEIRRRYPVLSETSPEDRRVMLYVPTFRKGRGIDVESLRESATRHGFILAVKPHPLDRTALESAEGMILDDEFSSYDWLSVADVVVSDYSSYVVEATLADKPLYLYTYDKNEYLEGTGLNVSFSEEAIGRYEYSDAESLVRAAASEEYDMDALRLFRSKYIDVDTEDCTGQLVDFMRRITK